MYDEKLFADIIYFYTCKKLEVQLSGIGQYDIDQRLGRPCKYYRYVTKRPSNMRQ